MKTVREFTVRGSGAERVIPLGSELIVGSRADADLRLASPGIASTHLMIHPASRGGYLIVGELEGLTPVRVNGERVDTSVRIVDGDVVSVGDLELRFRFQSTEPPSKRWQETRQIGAPAEIGPVLTTQDLLYELLELTTAASDHEHYLSDVLALTIASGRASAAAFVTLAAGGRVQVVARAGTSPIEGWERNAAALRDTEERLQIVLGDRSPAIFVPLARSPGEPTSALCCARRVGEQPFSTDEGDLLSSVSRLVAAGMRRLRLEREAHKLQEEVLEIIEKEQRRIGQDLHDGLCQDLLGIGYLVKHLERGLTTSPPSEDTDGFVAEASAIVKLLNNAIGRARGLARGLSPVGLEAYGLAAALGELAEQTSRIYSVPCSFACDEEALVRDDAIANHLYFLAREAVTNAAKHSKATQILVSMRVERAALVVCVSDDGVGIPDSAAKMPTGMGLRTMRYRARLIGAELTLSSTETGGTRVRCSLATSRAETAAERMFLTCALMSAPVQLVSGGRYSVGRGPDADVRIHSDRVSRTHAEIRWDQDRFVVTDLGSTNGTLLNGLLVEGGATLENRDRLSFGGCEAIVVMLEEGDTADLSDTGTRSISVSTLMEDAREETVDGSQGLDETVDG